MADAGTPTRGSGDQPKGGRLGKFGAVLFLLVVVYFSGVFTRPYLEREVRSDEKSRQDGVMLQQRVDQALAQIAEKERTEQIRLVSSAERPSLGNREQSGVPSSLFAELNRLKDIRDDLGNLRLQLARIEESGWHAEVVRHFKEVVTKKLVALEPVKQ